MFWRRVWEWKWKGEELSGSVAVIHKQCGEKLVRRIKVEIVAEWALMSLVKRWKCRGWSSRRRAKEIFRQQERAKLCWHPSSSATPLADITRYLSEQPAVVNP